MVKPRLLNGPQQTDTNDLSETGDLRMLENSLEIVSQ